MLYNLYNISQRCNITDVSKKKKKPVIDLDFLDFVANFNLDFVVLQVDGLDFAAKVVPSMNYLRPDRAVNNFANFLPARIMCRLGVVYRDRIAYRHLLLGLRRGYLFDNVFFAVRPLRFRIVREAAVQFTFQILVSRNYQTKLQIK